MEWWADKASDSLLALFFDLLLKGTILLLITWILLRFSGRTSAARRHFVWILSLLGVLLLPLGTYLLHDIRIRRPQTISTSILPRTSPIITTAPDPNPSAQKSPVIDSPSNDNLLGYLKTKETVSRFQSFLAFLHSTIWSLGIVLVWACGIAMVVSNLFVDVVRAYLWKRLANPVTKGPLVELLRKLSSDMGLKKTVVLLQSREMVMPMTWGIRCPVVMIPQNFPEWDEQRQKAVLLHELAHVKRRDCLTQMFAWMVCGLCWFNPMAWVAMRRLYEEREIACDDLVLKSGTEAESYAEHLVEVAHSFRRINVLSMSAIAIARRSQLEDRLLSILDGRRNRSGITRRSSVGMIIISIFFILLLAIYKTSAVLDGPTLSHFVDKVEFPTGNNPSDIARGDLDGDGKPDLVVVNYFDDTISILHNVSLTMDTIEYADRVDLPTGTNPISITIRDVDGDGKLDLIVANHFGKSISIFRNVAVAGKLNQSSFAPRIDLETEKGPMKATVCDFNNDGRPDLYVANNGHARGATISIFENTSSPGAISFAKRFNVQTGMQPIYVAAGDLDGDGKPDIVVANHLNFTITLLRNVNQGGHLSPDSFAPAFDIAASGAAQHPYRICLADLDLDGKPDIIVGSTSMVSVYRNSSVPGTFSFAKQVDFPSGSYNSVGLAVGDLNGDGRPDIALGHLGSNFVSILFNDTVPGLLNDHSFKKRVNLTSNNGASGIVIEDLNGDGIPDLAVANEKSSTVSVFRNGDLRR